MSNSSGWGLTARLVSKHFAGLGDKLSEAIASFDPETATEADRDNLAQNLRSAAEKLAIARKNFQKEQDDVDKLKALIANDENAFDVLAARLQAGTITEATVNLFCDELESNKARLGVEEQEAADAKQYLDELQKIIDGMADNLAKFDERAKRARADLAKAQAQKQLQELRVDRQAELAGLSGLKSSSTALDALSRRAAREASEAEALKIVADIGEKPLKDKEAIDEIRRSVASEAMPVETALDRLKRLSAK